MKKHFGFWRKMERDRHELLYRRIAGEWNLPGVLIQSSDFKYCVIVDPSLTVSLPPI